MTGSLTGTDSLIIFQEMLRGETVIYAVIYQQWGGEEDGVGHALATFLKKILYNPKSKENLITTTGFGDLVAQFISMHRVDKSSHPFYILPAIHGQKRKYNYYVTKNKSYATWVQFWYRCYTTDGIQVRMNNSKEMSVAEFVKMCAADTGITNIISYTTLAQEHNVHLGGGEFKLESMEVSTSSESRFDMP